MKYLLLTPSLFITLISATCFGQQEESTASLLLKSNWAKYSVNGVSQQNNLALNRAFQGNNSQNTNAFNVTNKPIGSASNDLPYALLALLASSKQIIKSLKDPFPKKQPIVPASQPIIIPSSIVILPKR